ncbi:MAG: hypothetical protein JSU04_05160 [Bdellovibrionales bacterium]|nr:hypothetical protein [Bdellovibrionales bacterium]
MTKKIFAIALTIAFCSGALSAEKKRGTASKTDPIKGLNCSLEYKASNSMLFAKASGDSGNWILGDKSKATLTDSTKGSVVTIEALEAKKKDFFRLKITQKNHDVVNAISEWSGMQITIPVNIKDNEVEDPVTFDQMRVTCEPTYLAG